MPISLVLIVILCMLSLFREEALLAAISEKDAHIALLETAGSKNPDEIETLHRHKEKLIKNLKDENARRVKLFNELKEEVAGIVGSRAPGQPTMMMGGVDAGMGPMAKDLKASPADPVSVHYLWNIGMPLTNMQSGLEAALLTSQLASEQP